VEVFIAILLLLMLPGLVTLFPSFAQEQQGETAGDDSESTSA
jgi:hypothetical protein